VSSFKYVIIKQEANGYRSESTESYYSSGNSHNKWKEERSFISKKKIPQSLENPTHDAALPAPFYSFTSPDFMVTA